MRVEYEALRPVQPRVAPIRPAINHQHFIVPQDHYRDGDGHFAT